MKYLVVQSCYLLLTGCREQEGIHLGLQCIIHLYVDVVARSLLLIIRVDTVNKAVILKSIEQDYCLCATEGIPNSCVALL